MHNMFLSGTDFWGGTLIRRTTPFREAWALTPIMAFPYMHGSTRYDVCCLISLVIPLVCGSVNELVDCLIPSIMSLALTLGRLVVDVLDKIAGIFPCRMFCFVAVFWIA
jgi:hypothetical protein